MDKSFSNLYSQFTSVVEKGTEEEAKNFLIEHFRELPKDIQESFVSLLVDEALDIKTDEMKVINEAAKKGIESSEESKRIIESAKERLTQVSE